MNHYKGNDGDHIKRGGKYNSYAIGHEVCNFSSSNGTLYGYVQSAGKINIARLGASKTDESISGVTVIWTAVPKSGGTVVIGWYKDATIYRSAQPIKKPSKLQKENNVSNYRIKAPADSAVLLPPEKRTLIIPRAVKGGIGKSNVWFADEEESKEIVGRAIDFISTGTLPELPDIDQNQTFLEGNPRLVAHLRRERNSAVIKAKKDATLQTKGKLCCEACGFNFKDFYGEFGDGFCEVHHIQPLSKTDGIVETKLSDLAIVCSNCHRIIHRSNPMFDIQKLSKIIRCQKP